MEIVRNLSEQAWRDFVSQHPQGNIFNTPEMFQVFAHSRGHHPELWAVVNESGQLLTLFLPVQVTLRDGLLRHLTTRSIAYGSVLCAPGTAGQEALSFLLYHYRCQSGRKVLFTEMRNLSDMSDIQPVLTHRGYKYVEHLNYLIDLACSPEQLLENIGTRTRKHIRREVKKGQLIVELVTEQCQLRTCYDLIKKSYITAHVPMADFSLFESAFKVLLPRDMVKFWLVRIDDAYVAASVELIYKDVIYGWYGGVDRAYSSRTPSELLTWHILNWGAENGFRVYDFGGAGTPDEKYGVRDFKSKFGGQLVCYGRNTYVHSPALLRISTAGYSVLRRFMH